MEDFGRFFVENRHMIRPVILMVPVILLANILPMTFCVFRFE